MTDRISKWKEEAQTVLDDETSNYYWLAKEALEIIEVLEANAYDFLRITNENYEAFKRLQIRAEKAEAELKKARDAAEWYRDQYTTQEKEPLDWETALSTEDKNGN